MKARSRHDDGIHPPRQVEPFVSCDGGHGIVYTILLVTVVGLLLIGLVADNYFSAIILGSLFGGAIVGLGLYRREGAFAVSISLPTRSPKGVCKPEPQHLVPFGPYGGGQWTAHPIGIVIVIGLLLMGLVSHTEVTPLLLASLAGGAVVGFLLWLRHR